MLDAGDTIMNMMFILDPNEHRFQYKDEYRMLLSKHIPKMDIS